MVRVSFACALLLSFGARLASAKTCSDVKAAGQRALHIPGGKGVGCHAGGVKDCCFCVYNMAKCEKAYHGACKATYEARLKEGYDGCNKTTTTTTTTPEPAPTFAVAKKCSDVQAAGQRALHIPGGKGVGCHAGGVKDCCFCVYNMTKCEKAFHGACKATYEARLKQGYDGCNKTTTTTTTPEPAPTFALAKKCSDVRAAGQRALHIPGGKGVGCRAGGLKDCCYCVCDMAKCEKAYHGACKATDKARLKQDIVGCGPDFDDHCNPTPSPTPSPTPTPTPTPTPARIEENMSAIII